MKKLITLVMALFLLSSLVAAQDFGVDVSGNDYNGNPYGIQPGGPGLLGAFTVVDGYQCSEKADASNSQVLSSSRFCWNNKDGGSPGGTGKAHPAVIFQLFHLPAPDASSFDFKVDEITVREDQRKCIDVPIAGDDYFWQSFYCDTAQVKCEETFSYYTAGCDYDKCGEGEVLRVRGLRDVVDGGCRSEGWETEVCVPDTHFGFDCSKGDKQEEADSGQDGSGQNPGSGLIGEWHNQGVPEVVKPGEKFLIRTTFEALKDGDYYLEAGMLPGAFSIAIEGSLCDGDPHFAGKFVSLKAGQTADIDFKVLARDDPGSYRVVVGAYTGCLSVGGEKVGSFTRSVLVQEDDGSGFNGLLLFGAGTGGLILLVLLFVGIWLVVKKK